MSDCTVNFTSETAGTAIMFASPTSTYTANDDIALGNHIYGTNSTGQYGIVYTASGTIGGSAVGTGANNQVGANNAIYNAKTGVEVDAEMTGTIVD